VPFVQTWPSSQVLPWSTNSLYDSRGRSVGRALDWRSEGPWFNPGSRQVCSYFVIQRYIKVKVEHYLLFMFSPPKISWVVSGIKYICLHLFTVFNLIQPSSKQFICFDFGKKIVCYQIVFYVPWLEWVSRISIKLVRWLFLSRFWGENWLELKIKPP
jgi:hypothetical protein